MTKVCHKTPSNGSFAEFVNAVADSEYCRGALIVLMYHTHHARGEDLMNRSDSRPCATGRMPARGRARGAGWSSAPNVPGWTRARQSIFRASLTGLLVILIALVQAATSESADARRVLLGSWIGKATGPQGGPPTGDITVTFEKAPAAGIRGTILVKAPGGAQYSGQISNITLKNKLFTATATFKFGESPLEANVSGPLKGITIAGTFAVNTKDQKMGEGTFSITKVPAARK